MEKHFPQASLPSWVLLDHSHVIPSKRGRPRKFSGTVPFDKIGDISGYKSKVIPQIDEEKDALDNFMEVVKAYCEIIDRDLEYDSIMVYWGISGPSETLEALGEKYQITRERTRQIRNGHLKKIKNIFKGKIVSGLKCDSLILKSIHDLRDAFFKHHFLFDHNIHQILEAQNIVLTEDRKKHLLLFFDIFNIKMTSKIKAKDTLHFTRKIKDIHKFRSSYRVIKNYFLGNVKLISLKELSKKINIPYGLVKSIVYIISDIEEIEEDKYQTKNSKISAVKCAERVLELSDRPLDKDDLLPMVNDLRGKQVDKIHFFNDKNLENVGITGLWDLKSKDTNKDYIYELIKKALIYYNKPCTQNKIYKYVFKIRPDITMNQIIKNISVQQNVCFLKINNGKVILKEWENDYKSQILKNIRKRTPKTRGKLQLAIVKAIKGKNLSYPEISSAVIKITNFNRTNIGIRICDSKIVNIDKSQEPWIFSLKENYQEIVDDMINKTRNKITADIIDLFKKENKTELMRTDIIKYIISNNRVSIPQVYKLLKNKNIFSVKILSKKCSMVRINPGYNHG